MHLQGPPFQHRQPQQPDQQPPELQQPARQQQLPPPQPLGLPQRQQPRFPALAAEPRPLQPPFLPHPRFAVGAGPPGLPPSQPQHIGHGGLEGFTPYLRTESPRFGSGALTGPGGFHAPGPYAQHPPNGSGTVSPAYAGDADAANGRAPYAVPRPRLTLPDGGPQHSAGGAGVPHPRALQARSADCAPPGSFQHQQQGNWKARTGLAAPSTLSSSSTPRGGGSGGSPYDSPHAAAAASMYAGMGGPPRAAPSASPRGFAPPPGAGPAGGPSSPGGRRNTLGQRPQDPAEPMASAVLAAAAAAAAAARQQNGFADQGPGGQQRSVGTPRGGPPRPTHSPSPEVKPSVSQVNACWTPNVLV